MWGIGLNIYIYIYITIGIAVLFRFCQERTDYVLTEGPVKWTSQIRIVVMFVTADLETILCEYVISIIHLRKKLHTPSLHATTKPTVNKHTHTHTHDRHLIFTKCYQTKVSCFYNTYYYKSYLDRRLSTVIIPPTSHVRAYATLLLLIIRHQTVRYFAGLCWHNIHTIHEINLLFQSWHAGYTQFSIVISCIHTVQHGHLVDIQTEAG